jgi:ribosomal protein S18 acetylase RimI-like enzyme
MEPTIRQVTPADADQVRELHRQHYWRTNCLLLDQKFYDWQFTQAPEAGGRDHSVVAVDEKGLLLSYLGVVPMTIVHRGSRVDGAHLISWLSAPGVRGKGIGKALMSKMTSDYAFLFGRSVTPAALAIYRKLGFRYFDSCSRWLVVIDPSQALQLAVSPDAETDKRLAARAIAIGGGDGSYELSSQAPPGAEDLAARCLSEAIAFVRTQRYFQWRYVDHPHWKYLFLTVGAALQPSGMAVIRVEEVRGRPGRVMRVVEFLAGDSAQVPLARALCACARRENCAYVDAFGMSERFLTGLISVGGFQWHEEESIRLPYLLQPWDPALAPPGLLFFSRRVDGVGGLTDDITAIHVSKGDGNMDWPSWVPEGSVST